MKTIVLFLGWGAAFALLAVFFGWHLQSMSAFDLPGQGTANIWLWTALPLVAGLVAYLGWRPFNRQRALLQPIAFAFACSLCFALLLAGRIQQNKHELAVAEALEQARQQMRLLHQSRIGSLTEAGTSGNVIDRFERHRNRLTEQELALLRTIDERQQQRLQQVSERYREVLKSHDFRGPEYWVRLQSRAELDDERSHYLRLFEASRAFLQLVETLEQDYLADIAAHDLSEGARLVAIAELERVLIDLRALNLLRIRELDLAITEVSLELLDLLRGSWGRWQLNASESRLIFDQPQDEWRFFDLLTTLNHLLPQQ